MCIGPATGSGQNSSTSIFKEGMQLNWEGLLELDWVHQLQVCQQDPIHHAEGDVWTHTKMVIKELQQLPGFQQLALQEQRILLAAALLHDIAKPQCSISENGRISSPKHALIGASIARELLWDEPFQIREQVVALVRLHGLPIWVLNRPNPNAAVIKSSFRINNHLLYLLAKADMLGRICQDPEEMLYKVALFKELCIENECFKQARIFKNEHSRFKFFQNGMTYPAELFDNTQFTITIMCGIAGSGKDTYCQQQQLPMISLDNLRTKYKVKRGDQKKEGQIIQMAYEQAKELARKKQSFIWNTTGLKKDLRQKLVNALVPYNPFFKIVYIETSKKNLFQRRKGEIPDLVIYKMMRMLELPLWDEAHEIVYLRNE